MATMDIEGNDSRQDESPKTTPEKIFEGVIVAFLIAMIIVVFTDLGSLITREKTVFGNAFMEYEMKRETKEALEVAVEEGFSDPEMIEVKKISTGGRAYHYDVHMEATRDIDGKRINIVYSGGYLDGTLSEPIDLSHKRKSVEEQSSEEEQPPEDELESEPVNE